jgi:molecular chaperone DnaJ
MPHLRSGVRGDLHAHIDVMVPTRLDHDDIELLQAFKERTKGAAEVRSVQSANASHGGLFNRLRETFTGR